MQRLDEAGLEAAADMLDKFARHRHWYPATGNSWRDLDPLGRDEFLDIAAAVVSAYIEADGRGA